MKSCMKTLPLIAALGLVLLAGCSKDNGTGPTTPSSVQEWINQAWSQFDTGDYYNSGISFNSGYLVARADSLQAYQDSVAAVNTNDSLALVDATDRLETVRGQMVQIFSGSGWLATKSGNPESGNANFSAALAVDPGFIEALGGHAFALQAMQNWVMSNERVTATLALDPSWAFTHDTQINYLDLRLLRTENYFNMGEFQASLDEALALNAIVNPSTPLTPDEFNLATVEGRAALAQLINELDDLI